MVLIPTLLFDVSKSSKPEEKFKALVEVANVTSVAAENPRDPFKVNV